jgi:hypothetical protein
MHVNELLNKILEEFKHKLSNADACIVIGFSFRDEYLTDTFLDFIDMNKLFVVVSLTSLENVYHHPLKTDPPDPSVEPLIYRVPLHRNEVNQKTPLQRKRAPYLVCRICGRKRVAPDKSKSQQLHLH